VVIDESNDVAQGASKANSGVIHGGYDERNGTFKSRVSHAGNQMFAQLQRELHFGFRRVGSLVVALGDEGVANLERLLENGRKNGVPGLVIIRDRAELKRLEPNLSDDVVAAMRCKHTGITSPYEYCIALAENAITNGVEFRLRHRVTSIRQGRPLIVVCTNDQSKMVEIHASIVINCAGISADKIAAMMDDSFFSIIPRKGEYLVLDRSQGDLINHVLFPVPDAVKGKGILVSPTYWGNLLLGPTSRPADETRSRQDILKDIIGRAHELVPSFDVRRTITSYAGMRAKCDRGDFIVEESCKVPGFIHVAGIDSPGLTSSPAIAIEVAKLISNLKQDPLQLIPKRNFIARRPSIIENPKPAGFRGRIDDPDPSLNIICRCERITQAEIEDAIHRPLGARNFMAVKKRTRAGMGQCQGKFCESRVKQVLSQQLHLPIDRIEGILPGTSLLQHIRPTDEDRDFLARLDAELKRRHAKI
jgi:glycerol-3-phosphate dehydrogenase